MFEVLRRPAYAKLFCAQVLALLGTGLLTVALGLLAFDLAGSSAGAVLGTALTIKMIAYVGVAPPIAALVDRMPKKAVLVGADAIRFAVALTLPFVTDVWQIYLLVFVLQSASATFTPAFQSLIPTVLPEPRDYTRALALSRLAYDLEALISPLIAAALLTVVAFTGLFAGTAAGFAASALLVLITRLPAAARADDADTFWTRLPLGAQVFARTPTLRFLMAANVVVAAATALVLVNSVVYARGLLGLGDAGLAATLAAYGLGSLAVAFVVPRLVERFGVLGTMTAGIAVTVLALAVSVPVTVVAEDGTGWLALLLTWVALGAGTSLVSTPSARLLAEASTARTRNLVYTAQFALSHACFLLTYPIAGWVGASSLLWAAVALTVLAAAAGAVAVVLARRCVRASRTDPVSAGNEASRSETR